MNKSHTAASNVPHAMVAPRRAFLQGLTGALALATLPVAGHSRPARAAAAVAVAAPNNALAALVAAVGGDLVTVSVDVGLDAAVLRIGDEEIPVAAGIVLKGQGPARARFLDDARNAPRVAAQIRAALQAADKDHVADYTSRHKQWSKAFVRKVLGWQTKLQSGPYKGKKAKPQGRTYLLDWAGIAVDPSGMTIPALAKLPQGPSAPTAAAYEAYVAALVSALA